MSWIRLARDLRPLDDISSIYGAGPSHLAQRLIAWYLRRLVEHSRYLPMKPNAFLQLISLPDRAASVKDSPHILTVGLGTPSTFDCHRDGCNCASNPTASKILQVI